MSDKTLRFAPLESCVDPSFWSELGSRKLAEYRLSEDEVSLTGYLSPTNRPQVPSPLYVDSSSFSAENASVRPGRHGVAGTLLNYNTYEGFVTADKPAALKKVGEEIWKDICSGAALENPALLSRFLLLSHADLKQFRFHYWFAFPALKAPSPFQILDTKSLEGALGAGVAAQVSAACDVWRGVGQPTPPSSPPAPFWLISLDSLPSPPTDGSPEPEGTSNVASLPLSAWKEQEAKGKVVLLAMSDPCHLTGNPGWPLRNLLLMVAVKLGLSKVQVVCHREGRGKGDPSRSLLLSIELPPLPEEWKAEGQPAPAAVGWEVNVQGKLGPRVVDLGPVMDPVRLAEQAVDLNLKLMRWRAAPDLDITTLAATRCLLLGAGTLGCAVARTLMAWGVKHITFVDSSRVSFSNPVRQSLFDFQDCLNGGRPKAEAAAEKLKLILPVMTSEGVKLSIPMPGHPPPSQQACDQMEKDASTLNRLVEDHDVVFLLTDTRESRWLPSLMCAAAGKLAITAALGFDTFVVMRHGGPPPTSPSPPNPATAATGPDSAAPSTSHPNSANGDGRSAGKRLGCYFCNDVVAPLNSTVDRTLDQQCTVARPGLAPIASAVAVELMAALMQHPEGIAAPANPREGEPSTALGPIPHQIRGTLSGFQQTVLEGHAFSQCTACSSTVVRAFQDQGWDFLLGAIKDPKALEDLTGLSKLHEQAAAMLADMDDDEDETDGRGAAGGDSRAEEEEEDWTEL